MKKTKLFGAAFVAHVMIILTCEALWMVIVGNPLTMKSWEMVINSITHFTLKAICFWTAMLSFTIACQLTYTVVDKLVDPVCDAIEEVKSLFCDENKNKSNGIEVEKPMMPTKKIDKIS